MNRYIDTVKRIFDFEVKGSTARIACLVLIATGVFSIYQRDISNGVAQWAIGAALWGIRDKQDC